MTEKTLTAQATTAPRFGMIAIGNLVPFPDNPRAHADPKRFQELKDSIRAKGVLTPLLVRPLPSGKLEVVAGSRRLAAAKAVGLTELPTSTTVLSDAEALEIALIDNLQREDLHPLDEAQGYGALLKRGFTTKEIGARIGKSDSYVQQRLVLQKLIPAAKKESLSDRISFGHARLIARLTPEQQKQTLEAVFDDAREWPGGEDGACTVKELVEWIQRHYHLDLHAAAFDKNDITLVPRAGRCVTCPKRTGANPALFPEVKKADTCTDPACFGQKLDAHLVRVRKLQKDPLASGESLLLSDDYNPTAAKKQEGRARSLWEEVKKGSCPHVQRGILVDGPRRGHLLSVCTYRQCPKHQNTGGRAASAPASKTERAENIRFRLEQDAKKLGLQRSLNLILERVQSAPASDRQAVALRRPDLNDVAVSFYLDIWYERRKKVAEMMGWQVKTTAYGNNTDALVRHNVPKLNARDLAKFLMACVVSAEVSGHYCSRFTQIERRYRVNRGVLTRGARQELKAKRQAKLRRQQAKQKGKAKAGTSASADKRGPTGRKAKHQEKRKAGSAMDRKRAPTSTVRRRPGTTASGRASSHKRRADARRRASKKK